MHRRCRIFETQRHDRCGRGVLDTVHQGSKVVGLSVPYCELFAGRSGYRESVGDSRYARWWPRVRQSLRLICAYCWQSRRFPPVGTRAVQTQ